MAQEGRETSPMTQEVKQTQSPQSAREADQQRVSLLKRVKNKLIRNVGNALYGGPGGLLEQMSFNPGRGGYRLRPNENSGGVDATPRKSLEEEEEEKRKRQTSDISKTPTK